MRSVDLRRRTVLQLSDDLSGAGGDPLQRRLVLLPGVLRRGVSQPDLVDRGGHAAGKKPRPGTVPPDILPEETTIRRYASNFKFDLELASNSK